MTINKPTNLDTFSMMQALEEAIRADERAKIKDKIYGFWNQNKAVPTGNNTGMHGESLAAAAAVPVVPKMGKREKQLVQNLSRGFHAVPTLAGNMGVSKQRIYAALHTLKANGYQIETRSVSGTAARYRKIYRLAKTA